MTELIGKIDRVVFHQPKNGYSILSLVADEYPKPIVAIGTALSPAKGHMVSCKGSWETNPKYGMQFKAKEIAPYVPSSSKSIESYLANGEIEGIGPNLAKLIVKRFGDDTMHILDEEPERLLEIHGIGTKKLKQIVQSWKDHSAGRDAMIYMEGLGLTPGLSARIYGVYKEKTVAAIKDNPYQLMNDMVRVGFRTADAIAMKMGVSKDDPRRIRACIIYIIEQATIEGHVFVAGKDFPPKIQELTGVPDDFPVNQVLREMTFDKQLYFNLDGYYLPMYYYSELGTAQLLGNLLKTPKRGVEPIAEGELNIIGRMAATAYDEVQREAIRRSLLAKVMVLTGGPGTGKTTTVKGIIAAYQSRNMRILCAAPTGRAAKRMSEVTGLPAKTIHRLLEYNPEKGYQRNEKAPLSGDLLIVDESSMIDIVLMYTLLKAVPKDMTLILVGDIDQLPSVGPGNVLRDIIDCGKATVVRLTNIHRQANQSMIVANSHAVNNGQFPDISSHQGSNFIFLDQEDSLNAADKIVSLVAEQLPLSEGLGNSDIQVLTPMRQGPLGANELNRRLQNALNPYGMGIKCGDDTFRQNDKVMQIRNDYRKEVFNGDVGVIQSVNVRDKALYVQFDNDMVKYEQSDLEDLRLAYACTVHKSQGSEYPVVVMPVHDSHWIMLQRNLLYTGITRAKKKIVLVGTKKAIGRSVTNNTIPHRQSNLKNLLDVWG